MAHSKWLIPISINFHRLHIMYITYKLCNLSSLKAMLAYARLEAVINFSVLQRFPLERAGFMNSSSHISVKYFSYFYMSYRRGI
jgi:hypothetical protein